LWATILLWPDLIWLTSATPCLQFDSVHHASQSSTQSRSLNRWLDNRRKMRAVEVSIQTCNCNCGRKARFKMGSSVAGLGHRVWHSKDAYRAPSIRGRVSIQGPGNNFLPFRHKLCVPAGYFYAGADLYSQNPPLPQHLPFTKSPP
jgi:hypothetical protein